jgi:hypothetical protein
MQPADEAVLLLLLMTRLCRIYYEPKAAVAPCTCIEMDAQLWLRLGFSLGTCNLGNSI